MSYPNTECSNLQYLPSGNIISNSRFLHRDETKFEDNNKIFIDSGFEKNIYLKYNNPIHHIDNLLPRKHLEPKINSAFINAIGESEKTQKYNEKKYQITEQKREIIKDIVIHRNRKILEKEMSEKKNLEETLTRIIKDSLKFTKENSPMIAMIPNKISSVMNEINEKRKNRSSKNLNNISIGNSFNISMNSNNSTSHQNKYESNAFLKALGLDLQNLTYDSIKIDIDEAYNFIKKWKIGRADINEIIRMKVVNEIMNVEERRSVQKLKKINEEYKKYVGYKKNKNNTNRVIMKRTVDDYENNLSGKIIDSQNFIGENKQINKENYKIQIDQANSTYESKRFKNELSSINAKSTSNTLIRKDKNSNLIDSNHFISTNYSQSNHLNNFLTSNNINSPNQTIKNPSKDFKNYSIQVDKSYKKNEVPDVMKINTKHKKKYDSPSKRKVDFRLITKPELPQKKKRKLVLNSYKNIDRIMKIINNSDNLKSNQNICKHFRNIRYNKKIDDLTNKLLNLNKLTIQDYEELDNDI